MFNFLKNWFTPKKERYIYGGIHKLSQEEMADKYKKDLGNILFESNTRLTNFKPLDSELSNPVKYERPKKELRLDKNLTAFLGAIIYEQNKSGPITTREFARRWACLSSHGQRLSELRKLGFLSAEKQDTEYGKRFVWSYTEKGYDAIFKK